MKRIFTTVVILFCSFSLAHAQVPSYVPTNGLVGWWPFNGNVNDQSVHAYTGTTYGSWNYTTDRFGNANSAFNFNSPSRVETNATGMFTRQKISISVWVNTADTNRRYWVTKSNWTNASNEMFAAYQNTNSRIFLALKNNSNCAAGNGWVNTPLQGNYISPNQWVHYVFVCDSLNVKIYKNAVQIGTTTNVVGLDICNGGQLRFGAWWQFDPAYFKGKLDDIGVWNRDLTQQEITNLYNASSPSPCVAPILSVSGATSVCNGSSATLSASSSNYSSLNYLWSPSTGLNTSTGATVVASPTITTTYTITGTDPVTGCSSSVTRVITVKATPILNIANDTICSGTSTNLVASVIGTGTHTVNWSPSYGINTTTGSTVTFYSPTSANYKVVVINNLTGCSDTAYCNVLVLPKPTIYVNSPSVCIGGSGLLQASGANSYSWSPSATLSSATGTSVIASPTVNTSYTVIGVDNNGCVNSAVSNVTITNSAPSYVASIQGPSTVTVGTSVQLTDSTVGGVWSSFDPSIATINSFGVVTGISNGIDTISYTISNGCGSLSAYFVITAIGGSANNCLPSNVPVNGLIGWWPFCGNATDQSGSGNNGIVLGPNLTTDRFGTANAAYLFNGTSDYIYVPNSSSLNVTGTQLSISAWFYLNPQQVTNTYLSSGISKGGWDKGSGYELLYTLFKNASNRIDFQLSNSHGGLQSSNYTLPGIQNNWIMVTSTFNNGVGQTYLNGQPIVTQYNGFTPNHFFSNFDSLLFGVRNSSNNPNYLGHVKGKMDDIGIWSRALTASEVLALYNNYSANGASPCATINASVSTNMPTSICAGDSCMLTASPNNPTNYQYQWYNNGNIITGSTGTNYIARQPGNYSVQLATGGCSDTSNVVNITSNAQAPNSISAIQGPSTVLVGSTIQLTDSTQGGVWSSSNPNIAIINSNGMVSGITAGIDTIWYTYSNGCGQINTSHVVTVNSINCGFNDSIYASRPTTFCQGDSTVLHAVSTGAGYTYTWYNQNGNMFKPWPTIGAYQSGTYYAIISNGTCSDTSNLITVTVNQTTIPSFNLTSSNGTLLCSNDSTVLTAHLSSIYNCTWYKNGVLITGIGIHDTSIVVSQNGYYYVTVANGGCPRSSNGITITVSPANFNANLSLIYGTATICQLADSALLQVSPNSGYNYQWIQNGTNVANYNGSWWKTHQPGTYQVIVSAGSCVDTSNTFVVNSCSGGGGTSGGSTCSINNNLNFNSGHWNNWIGYTGTNAGFQSPMTNVVSTIDSNGINARHLIINTSGNDPYSGLPKLCPWGGAASIRLGNDGTGIESESIKYSMQVTDSIFSYSFALVLNNSGHALNDEPFFKVRFRNSQGAIISSLCDSFSLQISNLQYISSSSVGSGVKYSNWQTRTINLHNYINQIVSVEFITADCALSGHFGYAYLDADCLGSVSTNLNLSAIGNTTWCGNDSCTIVAPQCSGAYQWYRNGVFYASTNNNSIVVKQSGLYHVVFVNSSCFGSTDTIAVFANSNPNVTINPNNLSYINYYATPVQLSGSPSGGSLTGAGLNANNIFSPSFAGMGLKNVHYAYTDSNGCSSSITKTILVYDTIKCSVTDTTHYYDTLYTTVTDTLKFQVSLTGVNPPSNWHQISVYPNPAHDYLMINFGSNWSTMLNYQFQVHNVAGQLVESGLVTQQMHSCNLNNWTGPGTYTLTIRDASSQLKAKKIIILQ